LWFKCRKANHEEHKGHKEENAIMRFIIAIFWNRLEGRCRAGWRLLIQLIAFVMLLIGLTGVELFPLNRTLQKTLVAVVYLTEGIALAWLLGRFLDRRALCLVRL
jgi:hypothetical protein